MTRCCGFAYVGGTLLPGAPPGLAAAPHPGSPVAGPGGVIQYAMAPPPTAASLGANQALLAASGALTSNPLTAAVFAQSAMLPAGMQAVPSAAGLPTLAPGVPGMPGGVPGVRPQMAATAGPYGLQPMLYWYPSPPVSPQNAAFFVQAGPTVCVMKGVHFNAQAQDVLAFLEGVYEVRLLQVIVWFMYTCTCSIF